ncbi:FBP domain-containing protein [Streptosporangium sp. NPDC023615]|uniref:FBP domain-containing protein n=1 Tax=Streptosporangium sp. NPDC023615 TaxID=3154794 RepID=UPI00344AFCA5
MRPISEGEIRASFVNCTKGEAKRLAVPRDLDSRPWDDLDFLGWRDPASPGRTYLVAEHDGRLVGAALRRATPHAGHARRSMCSLCLTTHTGEGVSLMTARRTGGNGDSVGAYICTDLACSLYLRGKKDAGPGGRMPESLTLEEKIDRTVANVAEFLQKVTA